MGKKTNGEWFKEPVLGSIPQVTCPKCQATMTPEAVLCMSCGFNQLTSQYVDLPGKATSKRNHCRRRNRIFPKVAFISCIAVGILGIYIYLFYEAIMLEHREKLPAKMAYQLPELLNRPVNPKWMKDLKYESINKAFENIVEREMNAEYPLFKFDESIMLQLVGGIEQSGQYKSSTDTAIVLDNGNTIIEIPFADLKIKCRVRCDKNERQALIDKVAHQRALTFLMGKKLERPQSTSIKRSNTDPMLGKQEGGSKNKGLSKQR